jgi:hypothetical protein
MRSFDGRAALQILAWAVLISSVHSRWCQLENVKADVHGNYTFSGPWRLTECTTLALDHGMCTEADCPWRRKFGDEEIVELADHLHGNAALTALSMSSNAITDESALAIAEVLRDNEALTEMNLQHNQIGDQGAIAIAESLRANSVFTLLNLQHNMLTDEGGSALLAVLQSNISGLETLYLGNNDISENILAEVDMQNRQAMLPPADQLAQLREQEVQQGQGQQHLPSRDEL